ncbi:MAG: hypothetical protein Q8N97_04850 [Methanobacteriaceae archaeon]|nr:hypothetical protein [Methanobacteriaceae archaeon]
MSVISGSVGLVFFISYIYEYKTQKKDNFFKSFGLGFVVLLIAVLIWVYNSYISIIFGVSGFIIVMGLIHEYKTQKDEKQKNNFKKQH